jgi:peptidyl-prolyl cis-trans isomerase C
MFPKSCPTHRHPLQRDLPLSTLVRSLATVLLLLAVLSSLAACKPAEVIPSPSAEAFTATPSPETDLPTPTPTSTQLPTETPVPLAALVNGEGLTLAEFQAELKRFQESGTELATEHAEDASKFVLDDLVNQMLLAQAAAQSGYNLDEAALQNRIDQLAAQVGGSQALEEWMRLHQYTPEEFRQSLKRSLAAAWMRDQISGGLPEAVEQIHARQILLYNSKQADEVLAMLQAGQDFAKLAKNYDPISAGDLGWFPKGYLNEQALEEAAFTLQPGEYSGVIQTSLGFHLIQVIEHDPQRPLSPDARLSLQEAALAAWLQGQRAQSDIQIFIS